MHTWEITRTLYKVSDFISWQRSKSLILSPSFQRRSVWKAGAKSYLIDTIVRGLPIPILFIRERNTSLDSLEPSREVVDGQQRMRTLISFIQPALLSDLVPERDKFAVAAVHNPEIAGKAFAELPEVYRRRILDYQFSVHVLPAGVDDREILQIFARMNATGVKLNRQELRNAEYFGEFKTAMYQLALEQLPRWRAWRVFSEDAISRMDEVELTSEFAMLILKGVGGKGHAALDALYGSLDEAFPERAELERRFRSVMDAIDDKFGMLLAESAFRKKAPFYGLFGAFYDRMFGLGSGLEKAKAKALAEEWISWVDKAGRRLGDGSAPEAVLNAIERRTTHPGSRTRLIKYLVK